MANTPRDVQQYSARMHRWVTVLWAASLILVVLERFSAATIQLVHGGFAEGAVRTLGCEVVAAMPELLFVAALWWIRRALADFARGELFGPSVTWMLDRVGLALALGAAARIFVVPGVCRLLGVNPGYWIAFDAAGLVVGATGLALRAIAGALRHASTIQSELNEIF
jgi:hypothetical protein